MKIMGIGKKGQGLCQFPTPLLPRKRPQAFSNFLDARAYSSYFYLGFFFMCLFSNVFVFWFVLSLQFFRQSPWLIWMFQEQGMLITFVHCTLVGDIYNHYPDWWSRTTCFTQDCTLKQCVIPRRRKTLGFLIQDLIYRFLSTAVSLFNSPDIVEVSSVWYTYYGQKA